MKIAMLTNNYKPFIGGVPISIERLANGLEMLGHEVYIFAPTYEGQEAEVNVIRYKSFSQKLAGFIVVPNCFDKIVEKKIRELDVDIIHTHHPMIIGNTAIRLGKKLGIPVVFTYHTKYEEYLHYLVNSNVIHISNSKILEVCEKYIRCKMLPKYIRSYGNRCDLLIAPSSEIKKNLIEKGIKTPIEILPTGVPDILFNTDYQSAQKIRQHYLNQKKFLFCTVSRLAKEKNIDFIIKGLNLLKNDLGDIFNFIIIGDGPEKNRLELLCGSFNLEDNVFFVGEKPNEIIKEYQAACDLFLFASTSETQGIVLIEAMAAGLSVIAVKSTGVNDVVIDGINGICTEGYIDKWVNGIKKVICNKNLKDNLCKGAHETAISYSSSNIALIAEKLYGKILNKKKAEEYEKETDSYKANKRYYKFYNHQIFKKG